MKAYEVVAVDVDRMRYCPVCAVEAYGSVDGALEAAEDCGYGGPVLASDLDEVETCDCGEVLGG